MPNIPILSFNAGEFTPKIDARSDIEKFRRGCRHLENFIPQIYGCAERRPGLYYIASSYGGETVVRMVPFIYNSSIAYILEFGEYYIRVYYNSALLQEAPDTDIVIETPYTTEDLFALHIKQVGDVMWIVHPNYAQRKLIRTSAYTFQLAAIKFTTGPFLLRNDLIDPDVTYPATMTCNVTDVGDGGTLTCSGNIFESDHVGALFKLVHPRSTTYVSHSGEGTSSAINVKGNFTFNTHGTWTGTCHLQRRENSSSDNDWEDFRTYISNNDRNTQYSGVEDACNVEYRIKADPGMSAAFRADITVNESTQTGIVKVTGYTSETVVDIEVLSELGSTNATKRWAEGAWSDVRGYPTSVAFKDNRCIYVGHSEVPDSALQVLEGAGQVRNEIDQTHANSYTDLKGVTWMGHTFLVGSTGYEIRKVAIYCQRVGSPGVVTASIRETYIYGGFIWLPLTVDLIARSVNGNSISTSKEWVEFEFPYGVSLTADTSYAIVVSAINGGGSNYLRWWGSSDNVLDNEQKDASSDSGENWGYVPDFDFCYKTYGPYA